MQWLSWKALNFTPDAVVPFPDDHQSNQWRQCNCHSISGVLVILRLLADWCCISCLDPQLGSKIRKWTKKYVEVSGGIFRYFVDRSEREETGVIVQLSDAFASIQGKRLLRLESPSGLRLFRAQSETKAYQWLLVISRYCSVPPTAQGQNVLVIFFQLSPRVAKLWPGAASGPLTSLIRPAK